MKIYVWRGERVLENYSSGMVIAAAPDLDAAWEKLSQSDIDAFWLLKTGRRLNLYEGPDSEFSKYMIDSDTQENGGLAQPEDGFPVQPEEYTIDALPLLVQWGGE